MTKILVPPEVLIQVSQQFHQASLQFEWTVNQLNYQMDTMLLWEGTTRQRFYADYDRARLDLKRVIELMESVSVELKGISIKFRLLDEEVSSKIASSGRSEPPPEPKTWQDHAEDLWEGVKTGGKNIANSIVDTGEALIEDPLGTIGDMAYNATIGTVEEVIDTSVWGAKMALDLGDTRDKFEESVDEAGGRDQYMGQQGAIIASNLIFGRVGLKNRRHDSGGEGGDDSKGVESNGNIPRQTVTSNKGNVLDVTPSANHTTVTNNPGPKDGQPNSSIDIVDSNKREILTRRWYGPDGRATRDVDYTHHKNPKTHPEAPHEHIWTYDENDNPDRSK
ncbi:WXG100 family type VII secretion target [Paenibacillus lemnae]|uniref:WXG100 family type VII secretion target n=1 Tax=Paenibacillus lemnae TaxID=1330551 RepID=A0A848M213_PAELE|nr:WXG100 family type VII secretion target [Paenibacillus lemnae]NMO95008.1 WXG100 family type VII secretion target [Paenibacillus lemnae]